MKSWCKLLALVLVLSLAGVSEAKAKGKDGKKGGKAVSGTVSAIGNGSITIDTSAKKTGAGKAQTLTTNASTTVKVDGVAGKSVADLVVGEKVKVTESGTVALAIEATSKAKHKKKK